MVGRKILSIKSSQISGVLFLNGKKNPGFIIDFERMKSCRVFFSRFHISLVFLPTVI